MRGVRSDSPVDGGYSFGESLNSLTALSRPHAAESLKDWSPRPVTSNRRPTLLPAGSPFSGVAEHADASAGGVVVVVSSSPQAAATMANIANNATNRERRLLRMWSLHGCAGDPRCGPRTYRAVTRWCTKGHQRLISRRRAVSASGPQIHGA